MNESHPLPEALDRHNLDRLYALLPPFYRGRDWEGGEPLRALLQVVSQQFQLLEDDIAALYENWFIETCQDWVVPYIGALVGYESVHEAGEPGSAVAARSGPINRILVPRRDVAATIGSRRRKGTLALLELLAAGSAGWPAARAVEFRDLLSVTYRANGRGSRQSQTISLRSNGWSGSSGTSEAEDALAGLGGPFETLTHSVDVRRINSFLTGGRYNINQVGLFVWRLRAYPVTQTPACNPEEIGLNCFTFSTLGNDAPLWTRRQREPDDPTHIAGELNLPIPLSRSAFARHKDFYYGDGKSLQIWQGMMGETGLELSPIETKNILVADLSGWQGPSRPEKVAVDPELGRIAFCPDAELPYGVWVSYFYGFPADLGGGEYPRPPRHIEGELRLVVREIPRAGEFGGIEAAYRSWKDRENPPSVAVIEIADSSEYTETPKITLRRGQSLHIRARSGTRPVLRLLNYELSRRDSLTIQHEKGSGEPGGCLSLEGLLISGRGVRVEGDLGRIDIRHCTLVPGWALDCDCEPLHSSRPSLEIYKSSARINIENSIIGSIQVTDDEKLREPVAISLSDSVLDATGADATALGATEGRLAFCDLKIVRCTIIGRILAHSLQLGQDSIFTSPLRVARRQIGCLRFCYVAPESRTPRRFGCQPDEAETLAGEQAARDKTAFGEPERQAVRARIRPRFNSLRYGTPDYCQLAANCPPEIAGGAEDESEMGVYHDLFQPQRAANLRARLEEYTPADAQAAIIFADYRAENLNKSKHHR